MPKRNRRKSRACNFSNALLFAQESRNQDVSSRKHSLSRYLRIFTADWEPTGWLASFSLYVFVSS